MEPIQHISSQFDYLERKQQENQQKITRVQEQSETHGQELQDQAHRIQKLEEELAETRAKLGQMPQFEEHFIRFRNEILEMVEERYNRRQQSLQELSHTLTRQIHEQTRIVDDLRRQVEKVQRYDEQILLARTEVERLNKDVTIFQTQLNELNKKLEERVQPIKYLEEQRQSDVRRLAELQSELPGIHKQLEANLTKIQLVEQQIPQFGKYELALEEVREEIRRHRDHMDFQIAQRERQIKDWTGFAEKQEKRLKEHESLMERYAEHYQLNKRTLQSLQTFQERVQREQHHVGELQRLAEERHRAELEKWQAEYEQRWKKQSIEWKPQFTDLQKNIETQQKQIDKVMHSHQAIAKQLDLILQIVEEDVQARMLAANEWRQRFEELADGQE